MELTTKELKNILQMIQDQTNLIGYAVKPLECFKNGYKQAVIDGVNLVEYTNDYVVYSITAYR